MKNSWTSKMAEELVGKNIQWEYANNWYKGTFLIRSGKVLETNGLNVNVNGDWLFLPELKNVKVLS